MKNDFFVSVTEFGVVGDGETINTEALQKAVDACAESGQTLFFPKGEYVTGTIKLKEHSHLYVTGAATILGSKDTADYREDVIGCIEGPKFNRCLLYAEDATDISIEGSGVIDGRGAGFKDGNRPMLVRFVRCSGVRFNDIHFRNSAGWCCHMILCEDVSMNNLSIYNHVQHNNDGLDLDSCKNVRITGCSLNTEDDSICLKGTTDTLCENITVTGCTVRSLTAAVKFGTSSKAGFRNITITGCAFYDCTMGAIKLLAVDGGIIENVILSNIAMHEVGSPLFIRIGKRNFDFNNPAEMSHLKITGAEDKVACRSIVRRIIMSNITATVTVPDKKRTPIMFAGLEDGKIDDVTLDNIRCIFPGGGTEEDSKIVVEEFPMAYPEQSYFGVLPAWGLYARHITNLKLSNVQLSLATEDARQMCYFEDCEGLSIRDCNFTK